MEATPDFVVGDVEELISALETQFADGKELTAFSDDVVGDTGTCPCSTGTCPCDY